MLIVCIASDASTYPANITTIMRLAIQPGPGGDGAGPGGDGAGPGGDGCFRLLARFAEKSNFDTYYVISGKRLHVSDCFMWIINQLGLLE